MSRRRKGEPPRLCRHKASGNGYVTIAKQRIYLGQFGSAECRRNYRTILREWEEEQKLIRVERGSTFYLGRGATIRELVEAFMQQVADVRYRTEGEHNGNWRSCRLFLVDGLAAQWGDWPAEEFRHSQFEEFRQHYVRKGYARNSIKRIISRILVLFKWAHKKGVVSAETLTSLTISPEPDEGEEREPVEPVPEDVIGKIMEGFLSWKGCQRRRRRQRERCLAMLQLQDLVGMRPGELCRMRRAEIRMDATVKVGSKIIQVTAEDGSAYRGWVFQPERHKTKKKGKYIAYLLGPQARALLEPWLPKEPEEYVWEGQRPGTHLDYSTYQAAVYAACDRAGVPRVALNRFRHNTATRYGMIAGIEAASNILNHSSLDVTSIYFQRNLQTVTGLVEKHG